MTTMQAPSLNGRTKKTLSHQLDRLDEILDGFADALQGAVRDAVVGSVGAVVRDAVAAAVGEVLAAQARLQADVIPLVLPPANVAEAPVARPSRWARFRARVAAATGALRATVGKIAVPTAVTIVARSIRIAMLGVTVGRLAVALVRGDRRAALCGLLAGLAAGLTCGFGDPAVAALVGGSAVAALTFATVMTAPIWRPWLSVMKEVAMSKGETAE